MNCLFILLLLFCCGGNNNSNRSCGCGCNDCDDNNCYDKREARAFDVDRGIWQDNDCSNDDNSFRRRDSKRDYSSKQDFPGYGRSETCGCEEKGEE